MMITVKFSLLERTLRGHRSQKHHRRGITPPLSFIRIDRENNMTYIAVNIKQKEPRDFYTSRLLIVLLIVTLLGLEVKVRNSNI